MPFRRGRKRSPYRKYPVRRGWSRLRSNAIYKQYLKDRGLLRCAVCGFFDPTVLPFFLIEIHHCVRVADGGGGDHANLLPLCPTHHNLSDRISKKNRGLNITKELLISLIREHEFNRDLTIKRTVPDRLSSDIKDLF